MDKVSKVNIEGKDYGFVAGQTVKGVSGALSADYVKHVILPEGAEVVEGMLVAVTFVNDNTAGYSGEKTVYSTDGINFYWDSGYTQLITLPPQGCYTVTATETQYEYKLSEYPVLVMGDMTKPFCDSRGHPAGGKLWQAGDTVTVINLENRFIALQTTVNEIIQGSSLPVTSGAVYEKCNSLEPVDHVTSGNLHSVTSNAVAGAIGQWVTIASGNGWRIDGLVAQNAQYLSFHAQGATFSFGELLLASLPAPFYTDVVTRFYFFSTNGSSVDFAYINVENNGVHIYPIGSGPIFGDCLVKIFQ